MLGVGACTIPFAALLMFKRIYVTEIEQVQKSPQSSPDKKTKPPFLVLKTEPLFRASKEYACLSTALNYNPGRISVWSIGDSMMSKRFFVDGSDMQAFDECGKKLWMMVQKQSLTQDFKMDTASLNGKTDYMTITGIVVGFCALTGGALALFHID